MLQIKKYFVFAIMNADKIINLKYVYIMKVKGGKMAVQIILIQISQ